MSHGSVFPLGSPRLWLPPDLQVPWQAGRQEPCHSPNLTLIGSQLSRTVIPVSSPWLSLTPFIPSRLPPQQILKHLFLRLLRKRISLGEVLGQRCSLCHQRTHNTHLAGPCPSESLPPFLPSHLSVHAFSPRLSILSPHQS